MVNGSSSDVPSTPTVIDQPPRRGFIGLLAGVLGLLLGLIPASLGVPFLLHPVLGRRKPNASTPGDSKSSDNSSSSHDGFVKLNVRFASLPADGTPIAVKVTADKDDAWNRFRNIEVGSIWVRRVNSTQAVAMSALCPHLGCAVDYRGAKRDFFCPCHTSSFDLDGQRTNQIPPRGMDHLEVKVDAASGELSVRYQKFRAGIAEKIEIS